MMRRGRLFEMLDGQSATAVTVLSAAVGYGKTTLLRSWCIERPEAVIWITLDPADDDPVRLWTHLATAAERLGHGVGREALAALGIPGASVEAVIDELMNGLVSYGRQATVVLDDLHTVNGDASLRSIRHAIERLPANARVARIDALGPLDRPRTAAGKEGTRGDPRPGPGVHGGGGLPAV
jgi:LuxR family transcriptional regulator, maltose regulon positive regulatory protein